MAAPRHIALRINGLAFLQVQEKANILQMYETLSGLAAVAESRASASAGESNRQRRLTARPP
jgi:hypothetical protein